jgi:Lysylphosphatidylglycerol synthase TM region
VGAFLHAVETFLAHLAAVAPGALALALLCHVAKMACRSRAWRNVVAAAYPAENVRWRDIAGAYAAGVGVNAVVPVRGGDLVKLYLAKRSIPGATYPTLASTFVVETIFDLAVSLTIFVWAIHQGVLPGLDVIPRLEAFDLNWLLDHPLAAVGFGAALLGGATAIVWRLSRQLAAFWRRVTQGFAILGDWSLYLRTVVLWQAADWCFRILGLVFFLHAFGIGVGLAPLDNLADALLVQVTQSISTLVPLTPAGIGTEQALIVYVFAGQVGTTALISFSVGMKLGLVAVNVVLGFGAILLAIGTVRWRRHMRLEAPPDASAATLRVPAGE